MLRFLKLIFCYIGRISLILYPLSLSRNINQALNWIYSYRIKFLLKKCGENLFINRYIKIFQPQNITIGKDVFIYKNSILATHSDRANLFVGNNVTIGESCHISCIGDIKIEDNVLMGRRVLISDNSHGCISKAAMETVPLRRPIINGGNIIIGKNVWIGDNVVILPGVHVGEGAIIGASTVVTKDVPPYSVSVGNPNRVIKSL